MIRLLIIDDSFFVRQVIKKMVSDDTEIQVIGEACNGKEGIEKIREHKPDVITLDLVMPVEDGLMTIEKVIAENLTPAVIFSSLSSPLSEISTSLYDMGLLHLLQKPSDPEKLSAVRDELIKCIRAAAKTDITKINKNFRSAVSSDTFDPEKLLILAFPGLKSEYLLEFLALIKTVQAPVMAHNSLSANGAEVLCRAIKKSSPMHVKFAEDGDLLAPARILLTPYRKAVEIISFKQHRSLQVINVNASSKPSLDTLLISAARAYTDKAILVLFPGMGQNDGIEGIISLRQAGSRVFIHKDQLMIHGMADEKQPGCVLPTKRLAEEVLDLLGQ